MKLTVLTVAAFVGLSAAAQAANLDLILNNTIKLTTQAGGQTIESNLLYQADGSITGAAGPAGSWEVKGDQLCTTLNRANNGASTTACSPLAAAENTKIGDTWTFAPADAVTITGELVAGR